RRPHDGRHLPGRHAQADLRQRRRGARLIRLRHAVQPDHVVSRAGHVLLIPHHKSSRPRCSGRLNDDTRLRPGAVAEDSESGVQPASPPIVNPSAWACRGRAHTVELMATVVPPQQATGSGYRRVPWSPGAWSQALYLAGGIPAQLALLLIPWLLVRWSGRWSFWSWPQWPVWCAGLAVMFLLIPVLTRVHRHRL